MKDINYECVGLHVAVILSEKQVKCLAHSVKFLINQGYDLGLLLIKLELKQNPLSLDLCDVINILHSLVATIDVFELNEEDTKPLMAAYKMHYVFNKIRYELEYGGQ